MGGARFREEVLGGQQGVVEVTIHADQGRLWRLKSEQNRILEQFVSADPAIDAVHHVSVGAIINHSIEDKPAVADRVDGDEWIQVWFDAAAYEDSIGDLVLSSQGQSKRSLAVGTYLSA